MGDRIEPARARPVCFCLYGFLPVPLTIPLVFVEALPCRRPACCIRTTSCRIAPFTALSKIPGARSTDPVGRPLRSRTLTLAIGRSAWDFFRFPNLQDRSAGAWHRAAYEDQVLVGTDVDHLQPLSRHADITHVSTHLHVLPDPGRRRTAP